MINEQDFINNCDKAQLNPEKIKKYTYAFSKFLSHFNKSTEKTDINTKIFNLYEGYKHIKSLKIVEEEDRNTFVLVMDALISNNNYTIITTNPVDKDSDEMNTIRVRFFICTIDLLKTIFENIEE